MHPLFLAIEEFFRDDYVVWRKGVGSIYGQMDFDTWRSHFGQMSKGSDFNIETSTIPEPAILQQVVLMAAVSLLWPCRHFIVSVNDR